jgi:hypothetical protein
MNDIDRNTENAGIRMNLLTFWRVHYKFSPYYSISFTVDLNAITTFFCFWHGMCYRMLCLDRKLLLLHLRFYRISCPRKGSNDVRRHVKCLLLLTDLNQNWNIQTIFTRLCQYNISWKSVHWDLSYFTRTDGGSGMRRQIIAFRRLLCTRA